MTKSYIEHFNMRGSAYDRAMRLFPDARESEFKQAVMAATIGKSMTVADVPAGGGYLQRYLPQGCRYVGHEPCESFINHGGEPSIAKPLLPLPWADRSIDVAISLAGVHHLNDKRAFFSDLRRVVSHAGRLVVSDVASGSAVAEFLDGYVGKHNTTGHEGFYLDNSTLQDLREVGWSIQSSTLIHYHWVFPSREAMSSFCQSLFELRYCTLKSIEKEIDAYLGVDRLLGGAVGMRWSLMTIVAC